MSCQEKGVYLGWTKSEWGCICDDGEMEKNEHWLGECYIERDRSYEVALEKEYHAVMDWYRTPEGSAESMDQLAVRLEQATRTAIERWRKDKQDPRWQWYEDKNPKLE